ncbi:DUF2029 domain-containing protein [Streptomyces tsukubensis]|nr:DUF2029 domain-containing protein [Streptomyces tsukubensis]
MDNTFVLRAARAVLDGESPYADRRFLYLPGAVVAALPQTLLPAAALAYVVPALGLGLVLLGWWAALRLFSVPPRSHYALVGVALAVLAFAPLANLVVIGNWTAMSAAALPCALLRAHRGRWIAAAAVIGLAITVKPMLVPVWLLFVLAKQWRALAVAVLLPAGLSLGMALLVPHPGYFFTRTLPFLLHGQDSFALLWDASLVAVLPRLGVPQTLATAVAVAVAVLGLWCARRRWRGDDAPAGSPEAALRLTETAVMVMLAAFLVSRPSFDHYLLVVLPLLLASGVLRSSAPRSPWFWIALLPQATGFHWPYADAPATRRAFRDAASLVVLAVTVMRRCAVGERRTLDEESGVPRTVPVTGRTPL